MIKYLKCYSDLHLEFADFKIPACKAKDKDTLLILAGDIHVKNGAVSFIKQYVNRYAGIVYVLGNHEHYGSDINYTLENIKTELKEVLKPKQYEKVKVAGNIVESCVFDNVRVIYGTLWSDFYGGEVKSMDNLTQYLNDFKVIRNHDNLLKPMDVFNYFKYAAFQIEEELRKYFDGTTVVVTHHLPSFKFISPYYKNFDNHRLNGGFASDLDRLIELYEPEFWICGHSHYSVDEKMFNTHVINNSRGYPKRFSYECLDNPKVFENVHFNSVHLVELDV